MKPNQVRILTFGLIATLAACGGADDAVPGPPVWGGGDGGPSGRVVVDTAEEEAALGFDASPSPDAPVVMDGLVGVNSSIVFASPFANAIVKTIDVFEPVVRLQLSSVSGADLPSIAAATALIEVPNATTPRMPVRLEQIGAPTVGTDDPARVTYTFGNVLVPLSDLPSGRVTLKVTFSTSTGAAIAGTVEFLVDAGPVITFVKPTEGEPFKNSARIEVKVEDPQFKPLSDIMIFLGDKPQAFEAVEPDTYVATIDFNAFVPRLSGEQLVTVRAKNSNGTQGVGARKFVADNVGPSFASLAPAKGQLIGGIIEISAVVTDLAGVEPSSVVAVIGNGNESQFEVRLNPPPAGSMVAKYSRLFDTKLLPANAIFPSISFRASDRLGNENTDGYLLSLDNMPPLSELDPPDDFRYDVNFSEIYRCSWPFDPVGPDAVDDGQLVNQAFDVRVRAEDQGNQVVAGNIDFVPIAGVKRVDLLVLDDTSRALVVDSDGDGRCDAVNPTLVPTTRPMGANDILLLGLEPLTASGQPDNFPEAPAPACLTGGLSQPVKPLCGTLAPTWNATKARHSEGPVISAHGHFMSVFTTYTQDKLPSVWTPGPIRAGVECAGRQLEARGSNISDGWACVAALAEDKLGLKQVSRPIRVCIDHDADGKECPHVPIIDVSWGSPVQVTTGKDHGLETGDDVFVQGLLCQTHANGKQKITVTGPRTFTVNGIVGRPEFEGVVYGCDDTAATGWVVPTKVMPDCSGTQTHKDPAPVVDDSSSCGPWRSYPRNERRYFN